MNIDWNESLRISELPDVDEALRNFSENRDENNAVGLVQVVIKRGIQAHIDGRTRDNQQKQLNELLPKYHNLLHWHNQMAQAVVLNHKWHLVHSPKNYHTSVLCDTNMQVINRAVRSLPMLLNCPICHAPHVDKDEWATKPHRTHKCEFCDHEWKPANVPTVGVEKL